MKIENYLSQYSKLAIFKGIKCDDVVTMLTCLEAYISKFNKDDYIIFYEDKVKFVGVVLKGEVAIIKEDLWGNRAILEVVSRDELFGESFVFSDNLPSTVSFVALHEATILFLPISKVINDCTKNCVYRKYLMDNIVNLIAHKNVKLMDKIEILSKKTLREKLCAYLINQGANNKYFTIPLGRNQLAQYLGVNRSALTRELNNMKEEGLIDFERDTFKILKRLY